MKVVLALITLVLGAGYWPAAISASTSLIGGRQAITSRNPSLSATPAGVASTVLRFSYPIGTPGQAPGDGFFIRHGYVTENTWYNPKWWHTGEDWYVRDNDTAGAHVYAVADGTVVYADANYPGRVVIVQHAPDLFSMYGHLDPRLNVRIGQRLARGTLIGLVLRRGDKVPNHLHFEIRTFLTTRVVNGTAPRYGYRCGVRCPPGPGYWPIRAPEHPGELGWRNPTHVIAQRAFDGTNGLGNVLVVARPVSPTITLWSQPQGAPGRTAVGIVTLHPGDHFPLVAMHTGPEDARGTSAQAYNLWYQIHLPDQRIGWVQAAVPTAFETGGNGQPSSVMFNFVPEATAT